MHDLLRQYAAEKLSQLPGAGEAVRDRHAVFYTAALERWATDLRGARQPAALAEIAIDVENVCTAWNRAVEMGQADRIGQGIGGLGLFYDLHGPCLDGQAACQAAVERLAATASGTGLRVVARALAWQGLFSLRVGQTDQATALLGQSLDALERAELAGEDIRREHAFSLLQRSELLLTMSLEQARHSFEQSLALYRALDDRWGMACALRGLGAIASDEGALVQARQLIQESLTLARGLGARDLMAEALWRLVLIAYHVGQVEEAERLARERCAILLELGGPVNTANAVWVLGAVLGWHGKFAEAIPLLEQYLATSEDMGSRTGVAWAELQLGDMARHRGSYERARAFEEEALKLYREIDRWGTENALQSLGKIALAEERYAEAQERLQDSAAISGEMGREDDLCGALSALGCTAQRLVQTQQAREHFYAALRMAIETSNVSDLYNVLALIAPFLADRGRPQRAIEVYALALRHPLVARSRWFEDVAGRDITAAAAALPPDVVAAAQARGHDGDLQATAREVLAELEDL